MNQAAIAIVAVFALTGFAPVKPDFGLEKGNVWVYSQKSDGNESTIKKSGTGFVKVGERQALEIKCEYSGGYVGYDYLGQDERGLLSYFNSQMQGPGVDVGTPPVVLVQLPFNKGLTWSWIQPFRGQTAGDVTAADIDRMKSFESAIIVSDSEEVKVAAGTFKAIHVRTTSQRDGEPATVRDAWYAPRVGLVKSVTVTPQGDSMLELQKFTPAR
jgi:hypothetical protein